MRFGGQLLLSKICCKASTWCCCLTFCWAQVRIVEASKSVYAAIVNNHVLVKIGPGRWDPTSIDQALSTGAWEQELAGPGFMVWGLT